MNIIRNIAIGGVALALAGCGAAASTDPANTTAGEVAITVPTAGVQTGGLRAEPNGAMPGVMGQIAAITGSTVTVEGQQQQASTTTVNLTGSTQIFKQATAGASNIVAGTTISAIGTKSGDTFTAMRVQLGGATMAGGQAPAEGGAMGSGARGNRVVGTVDQISGDIVTIKIAGGSTVQVKLAANAQISERVQGTVADLAVGSRVLARGEQSGAAVNATEIDILTPATVSR